MSRFVILLVLLTTAMAVPANEEFRPLVKCPHNELWSWCAKNCEPTCKVPVPNEKTCPELVCNPKKAACRCKEGFVRNEKKECVKLEKCKKKFVEV
ncbi:chymotrypsin inhibitor-like [Hylaeus anthracinus]|uniref:chymotrypsin inhibitor-like n=1 Tax=Hylaeus anthracinus TaxID=313031 RepID=UPI0023B89754|nr:chymotrypsin inhibitor-like [Hylaeus anthracinus]